MGGGPWRGPDQSDSQQACCQHSVTVAVFVYLRFESLQNQSSLTSCACPHAGALPESTLHLGTNTLNLGYKLQTLFSYQGQGKLSPVLRSTFGGGSSLCFSATAPYGPLLSCQKEGFPHTVMHSTAFPHLLPRACLGKTVIPLAEGQLSPVRSLQLSLGMELLELLELLERGTNRAAESGRPSQGLVQKPSLFSPKT